MEFMATIEAAAMQTDVQTIGAKPVLALLKLPQVKARCGLSRSELYRRISKGTFPAPDKLGNDEHSRSSAWVNTEIEKWISERIAERDARLAA